MKTSKTKANSRPTPLILSRLSRIKFFFLNLFFPKKCFGCNQPDTYLCRACFNKIDLCPNNTCFFCGKITWQGKICINCQKQNYLDRVIAATEYKNPLVQELIKKFKYDYVKELAKPLSQLLIKTLSQCWRLSLQHNVLAVPIPLYKYRERSRGFNQAELLAKKIADYFNLELKTDILKRIIPTEPQADIKDEETRKKNIQGVFALNPKSADWQVRGKNIILLDDVATTSATLNEAAKILKQNGAKEVWALVVAKG